MSYGRELTTSRLKSKHPLNVIFFPLELFQMTAIPACRPVCTQNHLGLDSCLGTSSKGTSEPCLSGWKTLHWTGRPSFQKYSFLTVRQSIPRGKFWDRDREGKQRLCEKRTEKGRRKTPCRLTPDAAGACFGRTEETQITEVASQKGNFQNGGFLKVRP